MNMTLFIGIIAFVGGFVTGVLFGRKNKNTTETVVGLAKKARK
jgi:hypothetical protein